MVTADISRIILLYKLPLQLVMLGLGLKAKIFGHGLGVEVLGLATCGLGLATCGLGLATQDLSLGNGLAT